MPKIQLILFTICATLTFTSTSFAQVTINGQVVEGEALQQLETWIGRSIPQGDYWRKPSGEWGEMGEDTVRGVLFTDDRVTQPFPDEVPKPTQPQ